MLILVAPFTNIVPGLKLLAVVGGTNAVRVADAAELVPALAVDIVPVLLVYTPEAIAVTGTAI